MTLGKDMLRHIVFGFIILMAPSVVLATDKHSDPQTITVTSYDPSSVTWTRGHIEVVYKSDQRLAVGLDFFMPTGRIVSMTISGSGWKTEITSIVSSLKSPYPLRSQLWIKKIDDGGKIAEGVLAIPFGPDGGPCEQMRIHFAYGRILDSAISPASLAQCEF